MVSSVARRFSQHCLGMATTGAVFKSLRSLVPAFSRGISSTSSTTQSAAAAAKAASAPTPAKEKVEFNYKDALNLESRLTEEEVKKCVMVH